MLFDLKVKIHPLFIILICFSVFFGNLHVVISYLLALFIHEMGHAFVAQYYKNELTSLCFMPYGAVINLKKEFMTPKQELLVAIAGPLINIISCLFIIVLWWFFPVFYNFTYYFCVSSFVTAVFNLLPLLPLDGSRCILALFSMFRKRSFIYKILKILTFVTGCVLIIFFIISAFYKINFSFALCGIFTILGVIDCEEYIYSRNYLLKLSDKKIIKTKTFAVKKEVSINEIYKYLSPDYYLVLLVLNDENKVVKTIYESEIISLLVEVKC